MDLQERHQLDVARQRVAKVKDRARPWQSIFAVILAIIAAAVSAQARHTADLLAIAPHSTSTMLAPLGREANLALEYGAAIAFFLFAAFATIGLGNKAREVLQPSVGSTHGAVIRFAILVAGGLATIVVTLQLLNIEVTQLIVGGAVTGVLVGIAAQQSLANVFAGIVLLMARPFQVGDRVGIRSGALSGLIEGTVTEVSVTYVRLETANGPIHVPNSQVLAAAVGPAGAVPSPPGQSPPPGAAQGQGTQPSGPGSAPAGTGTPALPGTPAPEPAAAERPTPPGPAAGPAVPSGSAVPSESAQPESPGQGPQRGACGQPS